MTSEVGGKVPGALMRSEIGQQPDVVAGLLDSLPAQVAPVAQEWARRPPRFAMLCARGTSDHAALYAKYLFEIQLGLPTGLVSPSTFSVYNADVDFRDSLVVLVSQSGTSPDLLATESAARRGGALTVAVTNQPDSELARQATVHVHADAGLEQAVAATKTYTAELVALWALVRALRGEGLDAAQSLASAVAEAVAVEPDAAALAARLRYADRMIVTARGYDYPTAREAALKLAETSAVAAHAFSGADLLHGPIAQVDEDTPVLLVAGSARSGATMLPVLARLAELGAEVLPVGAAEALPDTTVRLAVSAPGVPEDLRPVVDIVPLQLLALHLACERGRDPDRPRGLTKVTRTT